MAGGACSGKCRILGKVGDLCRGGMALCSAGENLLAERVLRIALDMSREHGLGPVLEAKAVNNLGLVLQSEGRSREALDAFGVALGLIRGRVGTDNKLYRTVNNNYQQVLGVQVAEYKRVTEACAGRCAPSTGPMSDPACACGRMACRN
ncbi:MAG: hypothetical protein PHX58_03085 [Desulfovibrio sp.]|nr:hypothetical protein [Desulfovibrio sp.]